jgi:hypothetical protein
MKKAAGLESTFVMLADYVFFRYTFRRGMYGLPAVPRFSGNDREAFAGRPANERGERPREVQMNRRGGE